MAAAVVADHQSSLLSFGTFDGIVGLQLWRRCLEQIGVHIVAAVMIISFSFVLQEQVEHGRQWAGGSEKQQRTLKDIFRHYLRLSDIIRRYPTLSDIIQHYPILSDVI
jgi:hypothetical protein